MRTIPNIIKRMLLILPFVALSCHDGEDEELLTTPGVQDTLPAGAIQLSPLDQTLDVAGLLGDTATTVTAVEVTTPEADFLLPLKQGRLYVEQNDDRQWRSATIAVTRADGSRCELTLAQPPATQATGDMIKRNFYRHHGLGYSYDAVGGEYCNLNYVRCQVLNRAVIDQMEEQEMEPFIHVHTISETRAEYKVFTSLVDYVQNSNFYANAEAGLIIFDGSVTAACSAFEEGVKESYILHDSRYYPKARYGLEPWSISEYADRYPQVFTSSFRKALAKLAATDNDDWRAVDEFLEVYGSHMVYDVELGASLNLDVQVETHKFNLKESKELVAKAALDEIFKVHAEVGTDTRNYEVLRNCKCRIDVIGGDMSLLDPIIGMTTFANEDIDISPEDLSKWSLSIKYNDDDLEHSNVEMTNMKVIPIWNLIPDQRVAQRIQARVYSNASAMLELLGNRNFINVKIPYSTTKYVCRVGNQRYTFTNPDVTDIIAAGRHVATICNELVPHIDGKTKVRVVYPIYEGHVKLGNGLCIHNGNMYSVNWLDGTLKVANNGAVPEGYDGNIYMNGGMMSTHRNSAYTYKEGHPVAGVERPGGIATDGSLSGTPVRVVKHLNHFYLNKNDRYDNLPNWHYTTELPAEAEEFPDYFDATWKNRMVRNDDYIYVYNTTEIGY